MGLKEEKNTARREPHYKTGDTDSQANEALLLLQRNGNICVTKASDGAWKRNESKMPSSQRRTSQEAQAATEADRAVLERPFPWSAVGPVERDPFDHGHQGGP